MELVEALAEHWISVFVLLLLFLMALYFLRVSNFGKTWGGFEVDDKDWSEGKLNVIVYDIACFTFGIPAILCTITLIAILMYKLA